MGKSVGRKPDAAIGKRKREEGRRKKRTKERSLGFVSFECKY